MSKKIYVVVGSVRPERVGRKVADWAFTKLRENDAELDFEIVDLKEENLPFMDEPSAPMMGNGYVHEHTKRWSEKIKAAHGFVFVTPEYNHGYPPALKNAVDYLYTEWKDKPLAFVGYGGSGAKDSIRQMKEIVEFVGLKVVATQVNINTVWEAFTENGEIKNELVEGDFSPLTKELHSLL